MEEKILVNLSVLEHSLLPDGFDGSKAVCDSVAIAKVSDELGFKRIWFSEHHGLQILQSGSPEVLIGAVGAQTKKIKIGSGGVMMANHSAYHVAENFRMLEALYPGRIDLGIGRAGGGDRFVQSLLRGDPEGFDWQVNMLSLFLCDGVDGAKAYPVVQASPDMWLLSTGGSAESGKLAAEKGMGLALALFINPEATPDAVQYYRDHFKPSKHFTEPQVIIAINCICSDKPDKIAELKKISDYFRIRRDLGSYLPAIPSSDEMKKIAITRDQSLYLDQISNREVCGFPAQVKEKIIERAKIYGADEVMMTILSYDVSDRLNSLKLIAHEFGLNK